jgi:hypothetical protein
VYNYFSSKLLYSILKHANGNSAILRILTAKMFSMAIFLCTMVVAGGDPTSFDISRVPRPHENEYFEMYYLQSSATSIDIESTTKFIPKRSALAVRSSTSEKVVVVEYRPADISLCFIPAVSQMKLTTDIVWDKSAMIDLSRDVNTTKWPVSVYLARINSVVYWQYMQWVSEYVLKHPLFIPQSVCMSSDYSKCPYRTQNWDTFIADR